MLSIPDKKNAERLKNLSNQLGMTKVGTLDLLIDFYELKKLDILIQQIKAQYREGFSAQQISQMTVLLTQLSVILQDRV